VKFLIDNALSPGVARLLRNAGQDAVILEFAGIENRVVVSADSDFAMLLALSRRSKPSFILFREADCIRAQEYVSRILECLPLFENDLDAGCVITFRRGRIRVHSFPIEDAR